MRIKVPEGKKKMEDKKRSEYDRRNRIQRISFTVSRRMSLKESARF